MTRAVNPAMLQETAEAMGVDPLFVERDWVLTEIIFHLAQRPEHRLVLKGGQALRHIHGSSRLSKDVDYVSSHRLDFEALRQHLTIRYPRLRLPTQPAGPTKYGLTVRPITYTGPLNVQGTVEVEISYREDVALDPRPLLYNSPFRDPFPVSVMDLHEMVAEKVRALYQRGNPRDLFDLWFIYYPADLVVQDAERHGVRVLAVDVRYSREHCTVEGEALRLGSRQIRGLSADASARIVTAMADEPPTIEALCQAAALSPEEARALARAGALQGFEPVRRQALWQAPVTARTVTDRWMPGVLRAIDPPLVWPTPSVLEELGLDRWATGVTPGRHLLTHLRTRLEARGAATAAALPRLSSDMGVCLAGQMVVRQRPPTARGLVFLSVSDETGMANVVLGPVVYERDRAIVRGEALLWVEGIGERRHGVPAIRAERVRPLRDLLRRATVEGTGLKPQDGGN